MADIALLALLYGGTVAAAVLAEAGRRWVIRRQARASKRSRLLR